MGKDHAICKGSDQSSYQDPSNDLDLCHDFSQKIISKIRDHFQNIPTSGIPNSIPPFDNNDLPKHLRQHLVVMYE